MRRGNSHRTYIGCCVVSNHNSIELVLRDDHPFQAAILLLPFLEKVCNGKGMICTPEVWAIRPRLVVLRPLLLDKIRDGAFPCIQQQPAPIPASACQTNNPLGYHTCPHWLHRTLDLACVDTPSRARASEIDGVGLEGYLGGSRSVFIDVGQVLQERDDGKGFSERGEIGWCQGRPAMRRWWRGENGECVNVGWESGEEAVERVKCGDNLRER